MYNRLDVSSRTIQPRKEQNMKRTVTFLSGMACMYLVMYVIAKIAMMDIPETVWEYEP